MTANAYPAPLPAFRQLARPCATLGCPNVLVATDRKRAPFVYRPASALTPLQQWDAKARETLELALQRARAKKALTR